MHDRIKAIKEQLVEIDREYDLNQPLDDDQSASSCAWDVSDALQVRINELSDLKSLVDVLLLEAEDIELEGEQDFSADDPETPDADGGSS